MKIMQYTTSDYINISSKEYAIYTAQNRAIPSSCDALKDGQRKALWLMRNRSEKIKTISLAGSMISENIFLHGDASAAETISRLAAPYLNNIPLLEGVGAFGTRVGPDSWGAPRYTYVKRNKATELLYHDIDIVPLKPNYDGSVMEPVHFLPLIPLVLLNGISGIAVGWSTDIMPHNLKDICEATICAIDQKPLPKILPKFDYLNVEVNELAENSYEFYGRVQIEGATVIRVTELPPDLTLEKFKIRLNTMEDEGLINTYIDRSTKTINVEIRFKRGNIDGWSESDAINFFKLKSKANQRLVVLDFNSTSIKQYDTVSDLIQAFADWRLTYYPLRYKKQLADLNYALNFACAIKACLVKGLPKLLPTLNNKQEVCDAIVKYTKGISIDEDQVDRIASLPSYRWSKNSMGDVDKEIEKLGLQIVDVEDILASPKKIKDAYKKEVQGLMKAWKI